jgi:hypothetical protein
MLNRDQLSSVLWFVIGFLICASSIPYRLGELRAPDMGFMPFWTGVAMCLLSALVFLEGTKAKKCGTKWENPFRGARWAKPLIAFLALIVYALLLEWLGFILTTLLLVGFLLRTIYPQKWSVVISASVLTSLMTYVVFRVWLQTQLPAGILSF